MKPMLVALIAFIGATVRSRASMQLEILALRHQLAVYKRSVKRPRLRPADRILWSWMSRIWPRWQQALLIVQPRTVIAWQRRRFRDHWTRLSRSGKTGRPTVSNEIRALIRRLSSANPLWGAPRIVGELHKVGIDVAQSAARCVAAPALYAGQRVNRRAEQWPAHLANLDLNGPTRRGAPGRIHTSSG